MGAGLLLLAAAVAQRRRRPPLEHMDTTPSHYQILGVEATADVATVAAAYRRLARRLHPDRDASPAAHRLMLRINAAHEVLKNPARRGAYDRELRLPPPVPQVVPWVVPAEPPLARRRHRLETTTGGCGSVLPFGRYAGQSLAQIARQDPGYLEWLARSAGGRQYRTEIEGLLGHGPLR